MTMDGMSEELQHLAPRRVCLIKPSALGDVIHSLPVLSVLRSRWPNAHISWVINRGLRDLVEGNPNLDEVMVFDRAQAGLGLRGLVVTSRFLRDLRERQFDLAIDLQGLFRSGLMTFATGAPVRIGRADSREGASTFYTHRIASTAIHAVDRLLDIAETLGGNRSSWQCDLPISPANDQWARDALSRVSRPLVVLNPGARWITKRWPPSHFAEIARLAVAQFGAGIVVVGAEEDRPLSEAIRRELSPLGIRILDLAGKTSLMELAAVMAQSDLVISNDTGPLHLAVASGARVVAVFTCTDPAKTGPYDPNSLVVQSRIWCAGSCVRSCNRLECMTELLPKKVWPVIRQVLEELQQEAA